MIDKQKAAKLLAEMRAKDPLYHYQPGATAKLFHESNAYFKLISGGAQTGKSNTAMVDLAMVLRGIHPTKKWFGPITAIAFAISRQQASMVSQTKLLRACGWPDLPGNPPGLFNCPLIPEREIADIGMQKVGVPTVYMIKMKNGSILYFAWSGVDDVWKKVQGVPLDYINVDENAGNKKLILEARKRLLARQNPHNWAGCMNWSATGTEVNDAFEDYRTRCMDPNDKDHAYFEIQRNENPAVTEEAVARLKATMSEDDWKVHGTGEKTSAATVQIYGKQWSDERHMLKEDYQIHPSDNLWVGYDPGVAHPTGILIAAIRKEQPITHYYVKFWSHSRQTDDYDLKCLEQYLRGRRIAGWVYDTAASNTTKSGSSNMSILMEKLAVKGMTPICGYFKSIKNHWSGISLVRHYLSPDAYSIAVPPLIYVNPSQQSGGQLIRYQMMKYRGKEETKFTGEGGVVKKEDEAPDLIRYLCQRRIAYNPAWACGNPTQQVIHESLPPIPMAALEPEKVLTPYERHLTLSRDRQRTGRPILRAF